MGLHTQRAMLILTLFAVPVAFIWAQTEWILVNVLGIDSGIAALAGQWARILIIGLWPNLMFDVLKRFLQGQNIVWPTMVATSARTIAVLGLSYASTQYDYGFEGLGYASVASLWIMYLTLVVSMLLRHMYIKCFPRSYTAVEISDLDELDRLQDKDFAADEGNTDPEDNWPPLSMKIFEDWMEFLKLGIPGAASLFIEW
jgi:Na+-driven multidrug efflux pump